ncbi:hypothetical protein PQR53_12935 [Paraburkholderia fungorum]|uniref:hypothetical protein n=1 Tax=Paraburkholderia fungorum TaxID=134537 RepID=UPI0038B8BDBF
MTAMLFFLFVPLSMMRNVCVNKKQMSKEIRFGLSSFALNDAVSPLVTVTLSAMQQGGLFYLCSVNQFDEMFAYFLAP